MEEPLRPLALDAFMFVQAGRDLAGASTQENLFMIVQIGSLICASTAFLLTWVNPNQLSESDLVPDSPVRQSVMQTSISVSKDEILSGVSSWVKIRKSDDLIP